MAEHDPLRGRERAALIRQTYLDHPGETPDVDHKAAVSFRADDDFALDLVRHILGMANAGGGHLVIGFAEDTSGTLRPDPAMNDAIAATYAPSSLAAHVERHIRGTDKVSLRIHKDSYGGKVYPIIEIAGFERRPFFCRSTKKNTKGQEALKDGGFYIRSASARTVEIASPEEWDRLITLCVQRQQDEFLARLADLMASMGFPKPVGAQQLATPGPKERLMAFVAESSPIVEAELQRRKLYPAYLEVAHIPTGEHHWQHQELLSNAERSVVRRTGWPIGRVLHRDEGQPQPHPTGISA